MLDDLIELGIDILGEVLEAVISSRRKKRKKRKKEKARQKQEKQKQKKRMKDPWEYAGKRDPWD